MIFPQLRVIINDYAQVFNRFNACQPLVARLPAGHEPSICIGRVMRRDIQREDLFKKLN